MNALLVHVTVCYKVVFKVVLFFISAIKSLMKSWTHVADYELGACECSI